MDQEIVLQMKDGTAMLPSRLFSGMWRVQNLSHFG